MSRINNRGTNNLTSSKESSAVMRIEYIGETCQSLKAELSNTARPAPSMHKTPLCICTSWTQVTLRMLWSSTGRSGIKRSDMGASRETIIEQEKWPLLGTGNFGSESSRHMIYPKDMSYAWWSSALLDVTWRVYKINYNVIPITINKSLIKRHFHH